MTARELLELLQRQPDSILDLRLVANEEDYDYWIESLYLKGPTHHQKTEDGSECIALDGVASWVPDIDRLK